MPTVWEQLEAECLRIYSLPHNVIFLRDKRRQTPTEAEQIFLPPVHNPLWVTKYHSLGS
jgi:hypothetical protein